MKNIGCGVSVSKHEEVVETMQMGLPGMCCVVMLAGAEKMAMRDMLMTVMCRP